MPPCVAGVKKRGEEWGQVRTDRWRGLDPPKRIACVGVWGAQMLLFPLPLLRQLRESCFAKNSSRH